MFTGLIEEIGIVISLKRNQGLSLEISSNIILPKMKIGDSISVNGVCLTVTKLAMKSFFVDTVVETIKKTTLGTLKVGEQVNLESALKLNQNVGGHIVLGHVNNTLKISEINKCANSYLLTITAPNELQKYLIKEGSVAVDGVSLTIAQITANSFTCSIIPHTWSTTNINCRKAGDLVNIEWDILSKYVEKFTIEADAQKSNISEEWLSQMGY